MNKYLVSFKGREFGSTEMFRRVCGEIEAQAVSSAIEIFKHTYGHKYELIQLLSVDLRREGL